jgi:hypothetical protein
MKLEFPDSFSQNWQIANFMKIRPAGAELLQADGRTDGRRERHNEANSGFSQFGERA